MPLLYRQKRPDRRRYQILPKERLKSHDMIFRSNLLDGHVCWNCFTVKWYLIHEAGGPASHCIHQTKGFALGLGQGMLGLAFSLFLPPLSECSDAATPIEYPRRGGRVSLLFMSRGLAKIEFRHEDKMESSNEGVYDRPGREDL